MSSGHQLFVTTGAMTKKSRSKSDAMESVHSTAKALFSIGSIDKAQMLEYDRLCLVPSTEVGGVKSKNKFHATVVGTQNGDKKDLPK